MNTFITNDKNTNKLDVLKKLTGTVYLCHVLTFAFAGLPLLGFVLIGCYVMDRRTWPAAGLAPWLPMRLQLTIVASMSCFLAAGAT